MRALGRRQSGLVGEGELIDQDMAPAAGVVVRDLDLRGLPRQLRTSQLSQSRTSLLGPVVVRTTSPSTNKLTEVSTDTGVAAWAEDMMWSSRMCPSRLGSGRPRRSAPTALVLRHIPRGPVD